MLGPLELLPRRTGAQFQHELPQAGLGDLALPKQGPVSGREDPRRGKLRRHPAMVDGFRVQFAVGGQKGEVAPLAACDPFKVEERAVAAAVVVGLEGVVEADGLAGAVAGLVGPQRQLQRLGEASQLRGSARGTRLRILGA